MIEKFQMMHLRNAEHMQFVTDADKVFGKHRAEDQILAPAYDEFSRLRLEEEAAMAIEPSNVKVKEKNVVEHYRDRLHSKLFNYVKSILYDEADPLFEPAQRVMKVIKETGNPTRLSENAESAMLTTLGNKLEPYRADLETIGALPHLEKLLETNRQFMQLESECRESAAAGKLVYTPSASAVRKQVDPVYHKIVDTLNVFIRLNGEENYKTLIADLNTLVDKYDALLTARKGRKKEDEKKEDTN
ncbi:MAG: DUF6261 family protein [Tannerella sp.]|jgi:hypothetical protein|nr:DUF6261 family protein [Tannerella sp.]